MAELFVRAVTDPVLLIGTALTALLLASGPGRWTAFGTVRLGNNVRLPAGERGAGTGGFGAPGPPCCLGGCRRYRGLPDAWSPRGPQAAASVALLAHRVLTVGIAPIFALECWSR
jgi:hypothetical protein